MHENFLLPILIILFIAIVVVTIFRKLNLSPVLGYFVAGSFLAQVDSKVDAIDIPDLHSVAELGIVFLLFVIGLEMTFERLKSMRRYVFGFGMLQVTITGVILGCVLKFIKSYSVDTAIIIGGGLALSSSAIVMQVIIEKRTQSTQVGRLSIATLVLQDFAVIPLLVMLPLFAQNDTSGIHLAVGHALFKGVLVLITIFISGRLLLRPLFHIIGPANFSRTNEVFIATVLLIVLGMSWLTKHLELSDALGAFVAGVLIAETEFQHLAEECITPFKGILLGLFFMTVGMNIHFDTILNNFGSVMGMALSLVLIKSTIIVFLCLLFRFSLGASIHAGLSLAQGGEFAFILFRLAEQHGTIDNHTGQTLMLVVTITMAMTPLLSSIGYKIAKILDDSDMMDEKAILSEVADITNHVIIAGFGKVGKMVARLLETRHIRYVAIDIDADKVSEGRKENFAVYRGDGSQLKMLKNIAIDRAMCIIATVDNEVTMHKTLKVVSEFYPSLPIIIKSEDLTKAQDLKNMGASTIVPEKYETGLQLGGAVMRTAGISEYEISVIKNQFRNGEYVLAKNIIDDHQEEERDSEANSFS